MVIKDWPLKKDVWSVCCLVCTGDRFSRTMVT